MNKKTETPTCGICEGEMVHNVPRLGPVGGFVHKLTGKFECPDLKNKTVENVSYSILEEPPRTGWDLKVTPDFIINNIKPVNWFHRKMQELFFGFKWVKQK